jgi:ribulose 1,5-bisphosphate synthetase/thiazole synthase
MATKTVTREFPVTMERDVVVCGGGTSGTVAAIAAARNGAKTLLLESSGSLGGTSTNGGVNGLHGMQRHWKGEKVGEIIRGMAQEIRDRLIDMGGAIAEKGLPKDVRYDPELYRLLMDEMCQEAGVELLFQTYVIDAIKEDDAVTGVTFVNKSGKGAVTAKVVIDATGDGDVCTAAGAEFIKLRLNQRPMPFTLIFNLGGMNADYQKNFSMGEEDGRVKFLREGRERGEIEYAKGATNFGFFQVNHQMVREGKWRQGLGRVNMDMIYNSDSTDAKKLTEAWIYARKRVYEIVEFIRKSKGCEDAFVIYTSPMMGIRDSRNIVGDHVLTEEDFLACRKFPDAIGQSGRAMNVHPPFGVPEDKKKQWEPPFWTEIPEPFEIPFRALLPKGLKNILVAGRCISAKGLIQGSIRGEPQCIVAGQAAGTAAAIAVRDGVEPRRIDVKKLQALLKEQGAIFVGTETR